jgi:hypothetical protein
MRRVSWNLSASNPWNPQGLSRPIKRLLYLSLTTAVRNTTLHIHSRKQICINRNKSHPCWNLPTLSLSLSLSAQSQRKSVAFDFLLRRHVDCGPSITWEASSLWSTNIHSSRVSHQLLVLFANNYCISWQFHSLPCLQHTLFPRTVITYSQFPQNSMHICNENRK